MNVDSETVCQLLLIKGLIVPVRLWVLSIPYVKFNNVSLGGQMFALIP